MKTLAGKVLAIFVLICVFDVTLAKAQGNKKNKWREKTVCTARDNLAQACDLRLGNNRVHIFKNKWRVYDGTWLIAHDLPLVDKNPTWHRIELKKINGRSLLEVQFWSPAQGEVGVETLTWHVYEFAGRKATLKVAEVVQKRAVSSGREPAGEKLTVDAKNTYIYDPKEKFGLIPTKKGIEWRAGRRHGSL